MAKALTKKEIVEQLKISMQREISMMRELLANMHREELSLQFQDKTSWEYVMIERAQMIGQLSSLREIRLSASLKFEKEISYQEGEALEILSLRDQILALAEKMNQIKCRNEYLSQHLVLREGANLHIPLAQAPLQRAKKKSSIATYPRKK